MKISYTINIHEFLHCFFIKKMKTFKGYNFGRLWWKKILLWYLKYNTYALLYISKLDQIKKVEKHIMPIQKKSKVFKKKLINLFFPLHLTHYLKRFIEIIYVWSVCSFQKSWKICYNSNKLYKFRYWFHIYHQNIW